MNYKQKLKTRLYIAISYMVFGIILIVLTFVINTNKDFISSFGFALVVMGIARIRNYYMITKDEETIRKQQIVETDERNISISNKAKSTTFSLYILLSCTAIITLNFFNMHEVARWICYSVCLLVIIYWISYLVYQKKL